MEKTEEKRNTKTMKKYMKNLRKCNHKWIFSDNKKRAKCKKCNTEGYTHFNKKGKLTGVYDGGGWY